MEIDYRREKRITAKKLPRELTEFFITPYAGPAAKVHAVDASYNGFGFTTADDAKNLKEGSHVKMYPYGVSQYIRGRVIYKRTKGQQTKVGVQLIHSEGYKHYTSIIKKLHRDEE